MFRVKPSLGQTDLPWWGFFVFTREVSKMKCPKCELDSREGAKFCLKCGEKLELNCPQCGKKLPLLAEFCDECGQSLEETIGERTLPETESERKHVTVLFSDLSGYTAMSEKLDPEVVKEITGPKHGLILNRNYLLLSSAAMLEVWTTTSIAKLTVRKPTCFLTVSGK
jgi:hypothetical protein